MGNFQAFSEVKVKCLYFSPVAFLQNLTGVRMMLPMGQDSFRFSYFLLVLTEVFLTVLKINRNSFTFIHFEHAW